MSQEIGPVEDLRAIIFRGCEVALRRGLRLVPGRWGVQHSVLHVEGEYGGHWKCIDDENCLCPLSTLLLGTEVLSRVAREDVETLLGVDAVWVTGFTNGVDDAPAFRQFVEPAGMDPGEANQRRAAYELGREVRERFISEAA